MKLLPFILFFCCYTVFPQSFGYSLENSSNNARKASWDGVNLYEEYIYFSAYVLPVSESYRLQDALNTHKYVRLEKGVYSSTPIVMKSGQRLFGHPTITKLNTTVTIKAGSNKVRIQNMDVKNLIFEPGATIRNCFFKTLRFTPLTCTNCTMEDNTFINIDKGSVRFDCSTSGYFRNNRFIKLWSHTRSPQTVMKGNSQTTSFGNVVLWRNYLFPSGDATDFSNLASLTLIGIDAESWNNQNKGKKPLLYMRNMGDVKIGSFSGLNHGKYPTPTFEIQAKNLTMLGKNIYSRAGQDIVKTGSNLLMLSGKHEKYAFVNTSSSIHFKAYFKDKDVYMNSQKVSSKVSASQYDKMEDLLVKKNVETWKRPYFYKLPNPVGTSRMASRSGKKDQSAIIQNLINRNGIAELGEGIYYIAKPLIIKEGQGIIGIGSGKTAIVGITDDFALIHAKDDVSQKGKHSVRYHLAHLTLQGGEKGLYVSPVGRTNNRLQLSSCTFKNLIFRNQKNGIHFDQFYGVDNNFFDNVSFVDCKTGLFQEPNPTFNVVKGETSTMMYMDKNVFFNCQIIRCNVGYSMLAKRPNNLNAWIDCKFERNNISVDMEKAINPVFANCDFKYNRGEYIVGRDKSSSFYNCNFTGNSSKSIFKLRNGYVEGCNFSDNIPLFSHPSSEGFILNSTVKGNLGTMRNGILINNNFSNNTSLSYLMVELRDKKPLTIIDRRSNAKPQFLVRQN